MECTRLTEELLQAYIDKELSSEEMKEIEKHITQCPACRNRYERAKRIADVFKDVFDDVTPPDHLENLILENIRRREGSRRRRNFVIAFAASILIIISVIFLKTITPGAEITQNKQETINETKKEIAIVPERKSDALRAEKEEKQIPLGKKENAPAFAEKDTGFYLVFPEEGDVIDETGEIVFMVEREVEKIVFEVDGVEYTLSNVEPGKPITVPFKTDTAGPHNLRVKLPVEIGVVFYSVGEV